MSFLQKSVAKAVTSYGNRIKSLPAFKRWQVETRFNTYDYRKYGLLKDDMTHGIKVGHYSDKVVLREALRRLPREVSEARDFRMSQANLHSTCKTILPKEQWTTLETDIPYLTPYLDLVIKEFKEKEEWAARN